MLNIVKTKGALRSLTGGFVCLLHVRRIATALSNTHPRQGFDFVPLLCYGKRRRKQRRFRSFSSGGRESTLRLSDPEGARSALRCVTASVYKEERKQDFGCQRTSPGHL